MFLIFLPFSLPNELIAEIVLQVVDLHSLLLHGITEAYGHAAVGLGIEAPPIPKSAVLRKSP